jgi:dihydropteroate synthase
VAGRLAPLSLRPFGPGAAARAFPEPQADRARECEVLVGSDPDLLEALAAAGDGGPMLELRADAARGVLRGRRAAFETFAREWPPGAVLLDAIDAAWRPPAAARLMGVLNVTPDSFSDGGHLLEPDGRLAPARLAQRAAEMVSAGAEWLDLGGESTRPGSRGVSTSEELARVVPALEVLAEAGLSQHVSIDTQRCAVAEAALDLGARMVNDVSGGTREPELLDLVAAREASIVLMHMRGEPRTMQADPRYDDCVFEVARELRERQRAALDAGVRPERIWLDPGIGFGKSLPHNLELLARLAELRSLGSPLLVGVSRKAFVGRLSGVEEPDQRVLGTAAAVSACALGGAECLRVHDVAPMREALEVASAIADVRRAR